MDSGAEERDGNIKYLKILLIPVDFGAEKCDGNIKNLRFGWNSR